MGPVSAAEAIVATVNDELVLKSEFESQLQETRQRLIAQGTALPDEASLKQQVLDHIILERIQLQMAREYNLHATEAMLTNAIEMLAKENNMDVPTFYQSIEKSGHSIAAFKESLKKELEVNELRRLSIGRQIEVSQKEIESLVATQAPPSEALYTLNHFMISEVTGDAEKKVNTWVQQLREGKSLKENMQGGGVLKETLFTDKKMGELPTLFESVLPTLKAGDIANPIHSGTAFHVLKIIDIKKPQNMNADLKESAKNALRKKKYLEALQNWLVEIRKQAYVEIRKL